ncbi:MULTISPECIES: hypothetical protein [unclassified Sporosarcina]|uniref:hypothetical protein n=1 Tax=unclassified Sporosarcina TaxID=2647733 RepID=UPI001A92DB0F|nr:MULTISPECIES: hypothetical protein [unclassified Sporosarcina]MBO0587591.1 hypothetical protein [Sporosarcina sp. E16_8]MBO0602421.1 hypothetical protein [Sporosarcina sp. E16_3]
MLRFISNSRWFQTYKSYKLKNEENIRVFIYTKKSVVKFKEGRAILVEYVLPTGKFFVFVDGKHYNNLLTSHGSIIGVLQELNGIDGHLFSLIKEDSKFSFNGNLITIE